MINHVVMFKLKAGNELANQLAEFKAMLLALPPHIPQIKHLKVNINHDLQGEQFHLCIDSQFEDMNALRAYLAHPEHVKVSTQFKDKIIQRAAMDFVNS
ncbi:MAG: Dabb family protein [Mangrovibacterium sp.]